MWEMMQVWEQDKSFSRGFFIRETQSGSECSKHHCAVWQRFIRQFKRLEGINLQHFLQAKCSCFVGGRLGEWLLGKMISYFHLTASPQQCDFNWLHRFRTAKSIENNVCSAAETIVRPDRSLVASPRFSSQSHKTASSVVSLFKKCLPIAPPHIAHLSHAKWLKRSWQLMSFESLRWVMEKVFLSCFNVIDF